MFKSSANIFSYYSRASVSVRSSISDIAHDYFRSNFYRIFLRFSKNHKKMIRIPFINKVIKIILTFKQIHNTYSTFLKSVLDYNSLHIFSFFIKKLKYNECQLGWHLKNILSYIKNLHCFRVRYRKQ